MMPHDEWDAYSCWGEDDDDEFDPLGPDNPDDYLEEADES
jgi:hypothetical protein